MNNRMRSNRYYSNARKQSKKATLKNNLELQRNRRTFAMRVSSLLGEVAEKFAGKLKTFADTVRILAAGIKNGELQLVPTSEPNWREINDQRMMQYVRLKRESIGQLYDEAVKNTLFDTHCSFTGDLDSSIFKRPDQK